MFKSIAERDQYWNEVAQKALVGRTIKAVSYMSEKEAEQLGWSSRPVCFELDNGMLVFPQSDDEGNDGGALIVADNKSDLILPVL